MLCCDGIDQFVASEKYRRLIVIAASVQRDEDVINVNEPNQPI